MHVRTRNRIVVCCHTAIALILLGVLVWLCYQASPQKAVGLAIGAIVTIAAALVGTGIYVRAIKRVTRRILDEAGLRKEDLPHSDEQPIPILLPLARNRVELLAGMVAIGLIISAFMLKWTGMFEKWFAK